MRFALTFSFYPYVQNNDWFEPPADNKMADNCSSRESLRIAVKAKTWSPSQYEWLLAAQCIQPEEKERIGRFFFKKDAKLAVVGRLLIRAAVSSMMGLPYGQIKLSRTEKGKPYILNQPNGKTPSNRCNFNISHQGDYVVLAAEAQKLIGIDVMKVEWPRSTGIQDFFRTMERQLTPSEWSRVRCQTSDMQQLSVFYRFWCLKESYVKALGVGIGFEVSRLTFDISAEDLTPGVVTVSTTLSVDGVPADDWTFEETMLEDHCVAVATKPETDREQANDSQGERKGLAFTVWSVQDLLRKCEPLPGSEPDLLYWKHFSAKDEEPRGPRQ